MCFANFFRGLHSFSFLIRSPTRFWRRRTAFFDQVCLLWYFLVTSFKLNCSLTLHKGLPTWCEWVSGLSVTRSSTRLFSLTSELYRTKKKRERSEQFKEKEIFSWPSLCSLKWTFDLRVGRINAALLCQGKSVAAKTARPHSGVLLYRSFRYKVVSM